MKAQERAIINNYVQEMASSKRSVVSLESKILTLITPHSIKKTEIYKAIKKKKKPTNLPRRKLNIFLY